MSREALRRVNVSCVYIPSSNTAHTGFYTEPSLGSQAQGGCLIAGLFYNVLSACFPRALLKSNPAD